MNWRTILCGVVVSTMVLSSCNKDDDDPQEQEFDKGALLVNLSGNIILPSLNQFSSDLNDLNSEVAQLNQNTSEQELQSIRGRLLI